MTMWQNAPHELAHHARLLAARGGAGWDEASAGKRTEGTFEGAFRRDFSKKLCEGVVIFRLGLQKRSELG